MFSCAKVAVASAQVWKLAVADAQLLNVAVTVASAQVWKVAAADLMPSHL